jgi:hypothetical protein
MAEEELSANALVDAKNEYTKLLTSYLTPCITEGFISLYDDAKNEKDEKRHDSRYDDYSEIQIFQDFIKKIPKWNQDIIDKESERIVQKSKCEWLDRLLYGVFVSNAKVLSIVRIQPKTDDKMKLKIPKLRNFIHKCYVECGRELYKVAYLFDDEYITTIEKQKNIRDINSIVKDGVIEAVRKLLPIQDILKDCIGNIGGENTMNSTLHSESTENNNSENMFRKFTSSTKLKKGIEDIYSDNEIKLENEESLVSQKSLSLEGEKEESVVSDSEISHKSHTQKEESVVSVSHKSHTQKEESIVSHKSHTQKEESIVSHKSHTQKEESDVSVSHKPQKEESVVSYKSQHEMSNVSKTSERSKHLDPNIKKIRTNGIIRNKDRRKMLEQQMEPKQKKEQQYNIEKIDMSSYDDNEIITHNVEEYIEEEYISDN